MIMRRPVLVLLPVTARPHQPWAAFDPPQRPVFPRQVPDYARKRREDFHKSWENRPNLDRNHAKITPVLTPDYRLLLRDSINLNLRPRFEKLDITEGGQDLDLVERILFSSYSLASTLPRQKLRHFINGRRNHAFNARSRGRRQTELDQQSPIPIACITIERIAPNSVVFVA
jgi:hypothetical protein